jgi:hypothetical protein
VTFGATIATNENVACEFCHRSAASGRHYVFLEVVRTIMECGNGSESRPLIAEYYLYLKSPGARGQ